MSIERELDIESYFSYLLKQYEKLVYSICYRTCGNPFDAQDLTQDTCLAVYKHLGTFDRQYERAWICRIASNKAIDYMKSKKRLEECKADEFFTEVVDPGEGPEDAYIQKETKELVLSVCEQLKSPYREVAYEHFYLEKPMTEIAKEQDTNLKTVQTRVYRARAQIRKLLEERGGKRLCQQQYRIYIYRNRILKRGSREDFPTHRWKRF